MGDTDAAFQKPVIHRKGYSFSRQTTVYHNNSKFSLAGHVTKKTVPYLHVQHLSHDGGGVGCRGRGEIVCTHHAPDPHGTDTVLSFDSGNHGTSPVRKVLLSSPFYEWGSWRMIIEQGVQEASWCQEGTEPEFTLQNSWVFDHVLCSIWLSSTLKGFLGHRGKFKETEKIQSRPAPTPSFIISKKMMLTHVQQELSTLSSHLTLSSVGWRDSFI